MSQARTYTKKADRLLLSMDETRRALGPAVSLTSTSRDNPLPAGGSVLRSAAVDSAYRRFSGRVNREGAETALAVGALALVFDTPEKAAHTFAQVARAAHLRTDIDGSHVAVETVTGPTGLVSYWGFLHRHQAIVILTLDTVDPQHVSVADLRSLVSQAALRLERADRP